MKQIPQNIPVKTDRRIENLNNPSTIKKIKPII